MKNKIILIFLFIICFQSLKAENLNIKSSEITIDKKSGTTTFKRNVIATDDENNVLKSDNAEYKKDIEYLFSKGPTSITTSEGYFLTGENIIFDNQNKLIKSEDNAVLKDLENNIIYLDNFEYSTKKIFLDLSEK